MAHTFLFEPAVWIATGTFWRGDGEPLEAVGRTEIAHRDGCWLLSGTLKVSARIELPMRMFRFSVTYLMWLFAALLVDHYLPAPLGSAHFG